jgi:hypothetical protein
MLRPLALAALLAAPVFAIEDPVEATPEADAYVPNRFSINGRAAFVKFADDGKEVHDTGSAGLSVGFRLGAWAELQLGAEFMKATVDAENTGGEGTVDIGDVRILPAHLDIRIDIAALDPYIPWPFAWFRPELVAGIGWAHVRLYEESSFPGDVKYESSALLRGGLALAFGERDARFSFTVEGVYTWVDRDIEIENANAAGEFHGSINLDYFEIALLVSLRF